MMRGTRDYLHTEAQVSRVESTSVRSVLEQRGRATLCRPRLTVVAAIVGAGRRSTEHKGG
jgi:hypothetical protein